MPDPGLIGFVLVVGTPALGALVVSRVRGRIGDALAVAFALVTAVVGGVLVARGGMTGVRIPLGGLVFVDRVVGRPVPLFGFVLDPLGSLVLLGAVVIGVVCVLYSTVYVGPGNRELPASDDRRRYFFWMLLFIGAMAGLVTSATLLQLFLFWEVTTVCSWALIGYYEQEHGALAAAYKAFLMTAAGGLALFASIIALLALTGSVDFGAFALLPGGPRAGAATALLVLLLIGAWAKSAQVPFHTWLPDAMVAPSPVSAYLHAASMVNAGVFLVLRVVTATPPPADAPAATAAFVLPPPVVALLGGMAVLTLVVAVVQFFYQDDLKRLLALSTISHLSYVLIGAALGAAGSVRAAQGAALHILAHGVGKGLLFLAVGALSYALGTRSVRDLSGVLARAPVPAIAFLIGALTVTGVPPFAGFWSKFYLISGAVQLGGVGTAVGLLLLIESVVAFAWFLWIGQRVFLGRPSPAVEAAAPTGRAINVSLVLLMLLCLAITLVGLPLAQAVGLGVAGR